MLVDVDQRLCTLKEEFKQMNSTSVEENAKNVRDLLQQVEDQVSAVQGTLEDQIHGLEQQVSSSSDVTPSIEGKIDAMQKSLEEKIGMVMLELDSRCPS